MHTHFWKLALAALLMMQRPVVAALPSGYVVGWGSNIGGEATGTPTGSPPGSVNSATGIVNIAGKILDNVVAISAGQGHSLALTSDDKLFGWGNNSFGEATGTQTPYPYRANGQLVLEGQTLKGVSQMSAGTHVSLVCKSDGTVVGWGEQPGDSHWGRMKLPARLSNVMEVAAGLRRCLALRKDGTVVEWGLDGTSITVPSEVTNLVAISAGRADHGRSLGLTRQGTVLAWGAETSYGDMTPPTGLSNVVAVAAGYNHSLALKSDGTVFGWGFNSRGQATGVPTKGDSLVANGLVRISGQVLRNIVAIAAAHEFSLALKRDGTVVAWGANECHQLDVPVGLTGVIAIAAGGDFCLALSTNAAVLSLKK
jgi:trimeric autotransporter adhesin